MQERDKERFLTSMSQLAATCQAEVSEALMGGYWIALSDLPIGDVEAAIGRAMRSSRFMPRPVELRELTGEVTPAARAVHAWQAVKKAIREHGAYASVDFEDRAVNAALRSLGGWLRICSSESEELDKWTRKDFEKLYAAFATSGVTEDSSRYLPGTHEGENTGKGLSATKVVRIATQQPQAPLLNGHNKRRELPANNKETT